MPEVNTPTAPVATPAKAKKTVAKKKEASKAAKAVHENKIKVLNKLKAGGELTLEQLEKKTGLTRRSVYHSIYHLREEGHVKDFHHENERSTFFGITASGKKLAEKA